MASEEDDSSTSFQRQRRDLFVVAALLVVAQVTEIKADKLAFLGMELRVEKATYLIAALWLLWLYWYWRFYQAFRAAVGTIKIYDAYLAAFLKRLKAETASQAVEIAKSKVREQWSESLRLEELQFGVRHRIAWNSATAVYIARIHNAKGEIISAPDTEVVLTGAPVWWLRARVLCFLAFNDFVISEYAMPFAFGVTPLIALALRSAQLI